MPYQEQIRNIQQRQFELEAMFNKAQTDPNVTVEILDHMKAQLAELSLEIGRLNKLQWYADRESVDIDEDY